MADDVLLNKAAAIERSVRRAREEYGADERSCPTPSPVIPIGSRGSRAKRRRWRLRDGRFPINTVLDEASAPITLLMNWHPEGKK